MRPHLSSSLPDALASHQLNVTNSGDRPFSAAGPHVWNYLPTDLSWTCHTPVSDSC